VTTDNKTASCEGENFTLKHPTREYVTGLTSLADISLLSTYCEKALRYNNKVVGVYKTQYDFEHDNKVNEIQS
jgi:hypothetical protein